MNSELRVKSRDCKSCTAIGKNLKPLIPAGPILDERGIEINVIAAIYRFSKFLTTFINEKTNAPNVLKIFEMYIENHGTPRSSRIDQEKFLVGHQLKTFCKRDNIEIIEAPVNDHRAVGLVEGLIQTIRNRLACIREEKSANN